MLIFVYVPGFYAAVEQADHPELRDRAVIVGGDPRKRGLVTSASAEARSAGVRDGMELDAALALCPIAVLRRTRLRRYREIAAELHATVRASSDRLEPVGLDGLYVEPPRARVPLEVAAEICVRIGAELGLRACAGVAPSRFAAFVAAREAGPSGLREIPEAALESTLAPLAVSELWGLGPATAERLAEHGVHRVGELQALSAKELEAIVGRNAATFFAQAHGSDRVPLRPAPPQKTLSRETTLERPSGDLRALGVEVGALAGHLEAMLSRERRAARTVTLGVRYVDGEETTRTVTVPDPVAGRAEIESHALDLLGRTQAGVRQVRRLRLQASRLTRALPEGAPRQLRLF
jgi:DNA polymerase-4